jgi:hypothetical protein
VSGGCGRAGLLALAAAMGCVKAVAAASDAACPPGEAIQWIADYCMATVETDDEIAASPCIATESARAFGSACAAKLHYKRKLCELVIRNGSRSGSVDGCAGDATFVGPTVEHGGVGG